MERRIRKTRRTKKRGGEKAIMDDYMKKRLGILLLVAVGGLAIPLGKLIWTLPIPLDWQWYLTIILGAIIIFGEEYLRHNFKISKEEAPTHPTQPTPVPAPAPAIIPPQ